MNLLYVKMFTRVILVLGFFWPLSCFQEGILYNYSYQSNIEVENGFLNESNELLSNRLAEKFNFQVETFIRNNSNYAKFSINSHSNDEYTQNSVIFEHEKDTFLIKQLFYSSKDQIYVLNLKKSLIDLLSIQLNGNRSFGYCNVERISNEDKSIKFLKLILKNCTKETLFKDEFKMNDDVLDAFIDRSLEVSYIIDKTNNNIQNISVIEVVKIGLSLYTNISKVIKINTLITLLSQEQKNELINVDSLDVKASKLELNYEKMRVNFDSNEESFLKIIKNLKTVQPGTKKGCRYLLKLMRALRVGSFNTNFLIKQLKDNLKKSKTLKFLIDAYIAAQTSTAFEALKSFLNLQKLDEKFSERKQSLANRFLISSSFTSHTNLYNMASYLFDIVKSDSIYNQDFKRASFYALGSVMRNVAKYSESRKIVDLYLNLIKGELLKCKNNDECKSIIYTSLINSRLKTGINMLDREISACNGNYQMSCLVAIKGLKNYHENQMSHSVCSRLFDLFQTNANGSLATQIRLESLNILVSKCYYLVSQKSLLKDILITIEKSIKNDFEFALFSYKIIIEQTKIDKNFKDLVNSINSAFVYYVLFIRGSSSFSRNLFGMNVGRSFSFDFKQITNKNDGLLNLLELSTSFEDKTTNIMLDFLKIEFYAQNLKSIDPNEDQLARVELNLLNNKIIRKELFRGYGSMLSTFWKISDFSGSLFDLNFLLNDQNEYIYLHNGQILNLNSVMVLSMDISMLSQISLWSSNANVVLKKSLGYEIETRINIYSGNKYGLIRLASNSELEADFYLDADYSQDETKTCLKILTDEIKIELNQEIETNTTKKYCNKRRIFIQPSTYFVSRKALNFCNKN